MRQHVVYRAEDYVGGFLFSLNRWVDRQLEKIPQNIGAEIRQQRDRLIGTYGDHSTSPFAVANRFLTHQRAKLLEGHIWSAYDEQLIRDCAENWARCASQIPQLAAREEFALFHGIEPPCGRHLTDRYEARAARLADPLWWRRALRKAWTRSSENAVRELGVVRKGKMPYASDDAVHFRGSMKRRAKAFQEGVVLSNELDEQLGLFDVAQASVANPSLRRGEFMTRVRGFEELANHRGDVALFFTLTTPSRFHAQLSSGGKNPNFYIAETKTQKRETVRSAQRWLCQMWARARAKLHRLGVTIYGFRIAEPHHDATPHWHGLFFMRPKHSDVVSDVITRTWLRESPDEPGARAHRVRVESIDKARGSAVGYIAKYVAKNIDGAGAIGVADDTETGAPVAHSISRIEAWAAIHGIRQFQQIGGPPIGLWREARKLREEVSNVDIERARRCADRGSWFGFCRAVTWEGQGTRRSDLKLWREETGERDKYGTCRAARVLGLCWGRHGELNPLQRAVTRPHRWRIEKKGRGTNTLAPRFDNSGVATAAGVGAPSLDPSAEFPAGVIRFRRPVSSAPWTRGNNCTADPGNSENSPRTLGGRWCRMTFPGQPGVPPFVCIDPPGGGGLQ